MKDTVTNFCYDCRKLTEFVHMHDTAHGLHGTHMDGSERFECEECGDAVYAYDPNAADFTFTLDRIPANA